MHNAFNFQFPIQVSLAGAQMQLKDLVCNASMLRQFLMVDGGEAVQNDLQTQLCDLPADVLQEAERLFLSQLDFTKLFRVRISGRGEHTTFCKLTSEIQRIQIQFSVSNDTDLLRYIYIYISL